MTHHLKVWPNCFEAILEGRKRFEWRKDDRGFEVGDVLTLCEWDPSPRDPELPLGPVGFTGRRLAVRVTYIARGVFGIPPNFCIMSIQYVE